GDVLLRDGRAQARRLEELLAERRLAHAERFRLRRDDALDALALDDAGLDAVDAHLVRAGLDGDALREADHRPLRRGVRAALREAVLARGRGQVDDAAAPRGLDHGHGLARAVEHAVQVHRDAALPVLGADVLHLGGRAGDAGVVHQDVEPAEVLLRLLEQPLDVRQARDIGADAEYFTGQRR